MGISNEPKPRTIENVQTDSFEVHSAYDSQYNDQPDIFDVVDVYHRGSDGFGLLQHSEISEVAQGSQFGGVYEGVALPASVAPGSNWQYAWVLSGTVPTDPPRPDEVRDQVTEHFHASSPGTLTLGWPGGAGT